ncbi:hypothetical protein GCM10028868_18160 [Virgibacillus kimchii]
MTCNYCTPDKHGKRMPLDIYTFPLKNHSVKKVKRNTLKIYRKRNKKKNYFIGSSSFDMSEDGKAMYRNNGLTFKREINYCPMCGRNLRQVIK